MADKLPQEKLMQYVWQHRLWLPSDMHTTDGLAVEVIDPGMLNTDAGPDFFNAKVRIGGHLWAGNVEIHVRASDWHRHGHDSDRAYDTVVLHVVDVDDCRIARPDGHLIPQVVLTPARDFSEQYHRMVSNPTAGLACADEIATVPRLYVTDWLSSLGFERLYAKADRIEELVARLNGDWREAVYVTLARALGFHTNSEPLERLALATPLSRLLHHQDDITTIEGALLGQAGLLPDNAAGAEGQYATRLAGEHSFITAKYGLTTPHNLGWKMARMRPQNFPHRRIAFLAAMIAGGFRIGQSIFAVRSLADAIALFNIRLSPFWTTHYTFASAQGSVMAVLGQSAVYSLIINVVVPLLHAYGRVYGSSDMQEAAVDLLYALPAEQNNVVRLFGAGGIGCDNAFTSQALIELRRIYCEPRKCLYCRLGHRFLANKAIRR